MDASGATALTEKLMGHEPLWSPKGDRLLFNDVLVEFRPGLIDPSKRSMEQTIERLPKMADTKFWIAADWSPDGNWLVGFREGGGIVLYSFEAKTVDLLTDGGHAPFWLPDSRRIVYYDGAAIAILDRETRKPQVVRPVTNSRPLTVSDDGRRVYVLRSTTRSDIWMSTQR